MKRKFLMGILALGVVGGYGSGFASLRCHHHHAHERRAAFERHIADVCVEAAQRAGRDGRGAAQEEPGARQK